MSNFKSATYLAAASLSALSTTAALPALAQGAALAPTGGVGPTIIHLQKPTAAQFSAQYHVPVVQDTTPMVSRPLDSAPPTNRLRDLQRLAVDSGVTWRKVYRVSPETAANPVTSLAQAEMMVDQPAQVALSSSGIPEAAAFKIVAAADNAIVYYTGGAAARDISVNLAGNTLPQAIAALALQTHTHWQAVYLLAPVIGDRQTPGRFVYAARTALTNRQREGIRENDGPFTIHFAYPPDAASTAPNAAVAAQASATPAAQPGAASAVAAVPGQQNGASPNPADPNAANPSGGAYSSPYQASPYGPFDGYNPYAYSEPNIAVTNSVTSTPFYGYGDGTTVVVGNGSVVSQ